MEKGPWKQREGRGAAAGHLRLLPLWSRARPLLLSGLVEPDSCEDSPWVGTETQRGVPVPHPLTGSSTTKGLLLLLLLLSPDPFVPWPASKNVTKGCPA